MKGELLRNLRKERKLTQLELAKHLGVTRSLIGMVETDKQEGGREFAKKVADFFNVSMDYLEGLTTERHEILVKKQVLLTDFLWFLVESKVIKDENNIDEDTQELIMNMVKREISKIRKENDCIL
ncbi:helix-turn-helix transcriptional regulator [Clostridium sp. D46t1_190503_E9]|uniref:helix-turn-helix domain-containing protein n=1 Tax=Clostridium sp. D46t1_190503_E9 TaxID=2787137 RepID=UPI0018973DDB|nr:helix-turn-helix transcriptional regulator [Clostridium sp. D46t1_190503_E9]